MMTFPVDIGGRQHVLGQMAKVNEYNKQGAPLTSLLFFLTEAC